MRIQVPTALDAQFPRGNRVGGDRLLEEHNAQPQMTDFASIKDVQDWFLSYGIYQPHKSIDSTWKDPWADYKMQVRPNRGQWHVRFLRRPKSESK